MIIEDLIERCEECRVVDKPYVKFEVYRKYLPDRVKILIISESPPPGDKEDFIYNLNRKDRLRSTLSQIFNIDDNLIPSLLKKLRIFWTTAVKCRPIDKSYIERMRRKCLKILKIEIDVLNPEYLIALGKVAWRSVEELNVGIPVVKHYHPLYLRRFMRDRLLDIKYIIFKILNIHNL